jgi:NTE family protein
MTNPASKAPASGKKRVNLALQGGGAHGAFTWGVIDRLLEDDRIEVEGLSGTSAGAMNSVATCQGLIINGNKGARKVLREFWEGIAEAGDKGQLKPGPIDKMMGLYTMYNTPAYMAFDTMIRMLSPYQFNPTDTDPLRDVILKTFDFDILRREVLHKVFLCATHVCDGNIRIFTNPELRPEVLLASGCLPLIHKAVEVEGEFYWDGGFVGNPAIYPLIYNCDAQDIIIVQLNPTRRAEIPHDVRGISDRLNEISNNMSLMREMRNIHFISDLINKGELSDKKHKRVHMHCIKNESVFAKLGFSSKLNSTSEFLNHLFEEGKACASEWLRENFDNLGVKSTMDF